MFVYCHSQKTPGKIPICKICNKEFKSRTILYRHRQTHMEKLIQCGSCHKMFSTVSQIQSHQAKLKHEKIFKCSPCLITFTSINDLKVSVRVGKSRDLAWQRHLFSNNFSHFMYLIEYFFTNSIAVLPFPSRFTSNRMSTQKRKGTEHNLRLVIRWSTSLNLTCKRIKHLEKSKPSFIFCFIFIFTKKANERTEFDQFS